MKVVGSTRIDWVFGMIENLSRIVTEIETERGPVSLCALMEQPEYLGEWDLILSAAWFGEGERAFLAYLMEKLQKQLTTKERHSISRIIPASPDDPRVRDIQRAVAGQRLPVRLSGLILAGVEIPSIYVIAGRTMGNAHVTAGISDADSNSTMEQSKSASSSYRGSGSIIITTSPATTGAVTYNVPAFDGRASVTIGNARKRKRS